MAINQISLPTTHQVVRETVNALIAKDPDNVVVYKTVADLPSAVGGVITITESNTKFMFDGAFDLGSDRIEFTGDQITIEGSNCSSSSITSTVSGNLVTITKAFNMRCMTLIGGTVNTHLLNCVDVGTAGANVRDVVFVNGGTGLYIENYGSCIIESSVFSGNVEGIHFNGSIQFILVAEDVFVGLTGVNINFNSLATFGCSVRHNAGILTATGTFLAIQANSGNIGTDGYGTIEVNKVDNSAGGTLITGYSPLDAKWEVFGNNLILDSDRNNPNGFGNYQDTGGVAREIVAGDGELNAVQLTVDGLGSASESGYLPRVIRGTDELWDTTTNTIKPITVGDTYTLRISLQITATGSNPTRITAVLDIGAGAFPSIPIAYGTETLRGGGFPEVYTIVLPVFSLGTFIANGGRIFVYCNSGTANIQNRSVLITRTSSGAS